MSTVDNEVASGTVGEPEEDTFCCDSEFRHLEEDETWEHGSCTQGVRRNSVMRDAQTIMGLRKTRVNSI